MVGFPVVLVLVHADLMREEQQPKSCESYPKKGVELLQTFCHTFLARNVFFQQYALGNKTN